MKNYPKIIKEEGVIYFTLCEQCGKVHPEMTIVYDELWSKISKDTGCDLLCRDCMEKSLGRKITLDDLKYYDEERTIMIPTNFKLCKELNKQEKRPLRYLTLEEFFLVHFRIFDHLNKNFYLRKAYKAYSKMKNKYKKDYLR
jgi:hypothetical protein